MFLWVTNKRTYQINICFPEWVTLSRLHFFGKFRKVNIRVHILQGELGFCCLMAKQIVELQFSREAKVVARWVYVFIVWLFYFHVSLVFPSVAVYISKCLLIDCLTLNQTRTPAQRKGKRRENNANHLTNYSSISVSDRYLTESMIWNSQYLSRTFVLT